MKRSVLAILVLLCCLLLPQAVAANAPGELHIFMQLDNPDITINGTVTTVETAPFVDNGTTLVPLRVISTAFGSIPEYNAEDRSILLPFADKTVKLWIDRTDTEINGVPAQPLLTAPRELNGRTMVPIRFIAETFGAVVNYNAEDRTITIVAQFATTTEEESGETPETPSPDTSSPAPNLDVDAGKTKIGNSHHGWSMNYPSNLVQERISFGEEFVYFSDLNGEFELYIDVEYDQDDLTKEALLRKLANDVVYYGEQILEQTTVNGPNGTYAKVVAKGDDYISEYRAFQVEDCIYTIELYVMDASNYRNSSKYAAYATLLDSFKPSFDRNDPEIKDLTAIKDGFKAYVNEDYGISLDVPATWFDMSSGEELRFRNNDGSEYVKLRVTSRAPGDTLGKWVQRHLDYYRTEYVPDYFVMEKDGTPISLSGIPASLIQFKVNYAKNKWAHIYHIFTIVGDYKYEISIVYETDEQLTADQINQLERILQSINIRKEATINLGYIHDEENLDRTKMSELKFRSLNLSIRIPDSWERLDLGNTVYYFAASGVFAVQKLPVTNESQLSRQKEVMLRELASSWNDYSINSDTPVQLNGMQGWKLTGTATETGTETQHHVIIYMVGANGNYYLIFVVIPYYTATSQNMAMFNEVFNSITPLP